MPIYGYIDVQDINVQDIICLYMVMPIYGYIDVQDIM